jgi:hypothetical protein
MIAQLFVLIIALSYGFAPELASYTGSAESVLAHIAGPLVALFATACCFPSLVFARYLNILIGVLLAVTPALAIHDNPTSLVIQFIAGLWITAFSILARPLHETGGWRRVIKDYDDVDIDWA